MPRYADYHRTVVGYHGTRRSVALKAVQRLESLEASRNPGDWLGHGIYFWEYAPQQAWLWAEFLRRKRKWAEETAVVACMIRLGNCFDLLDPDNVKVLRQAHEEYLSAERDADRTPASNVYSQKRRNCAVFELAYATFKRQGQEVDTCRAVFVPTGKDRLWEGSGINPRAHIQVVVRNPDCIVGTWLVKPLEEMDVDAEKQQAEEGGREPLPPGGLRVARDEAGGTHSDAGGSRPDGAGGSGSGEGPSPPAMS